MEKQVKLNIADVRYDNGVLKIDSTGASPRGKLYDVTVTLKDNVLIVEGMRPEWGMSLTTGSFDDCLDELTDDSIMVTNHKFLWWKWTTRRSKSYVEFKKKEVRMYSSPNWILEGESLKPLIQ